VKRAFLIAAVLIALVGFLVSTPDTGLAHDPVSTPTTEWDWSGDEINADANPLANGSQPYYQAIAEPDTTWDWSGDEINADANPLANGSQPYYQAIAEPDTTWDWSGDEINADANPRACKGCE